MTPYQTTLCDSVSCVGIGLHSGGMMQMTMRPAGAGTGVVFVRTDLPAADPAARTIAAHYGNVSQTALCTCISNHAGARAMTVEHVIAALSACGVDNVVVELNGEETPIMDGSAAPFAALVESVGIVRLDAPRRVIEILEPVEAAVDGGRAWLLPYSGFAFEVEIDFAAPAIGRQRFRADLACAHFRRDVLHARTFGLLEDVEAMRMGGFGRGGSLDNAVVVDGERILNGGGLRYRDEFVRHKLLDAVGDLYLAGASIRGLYRGVRAGHTVNNMLLKVLFDSPQAWEYAPLAAPILPDRVTRAVRPVAAA